MTIWRARIFVSRRTNFFFTSNYGDNFLFANAPTIAEATMTNSSGSGTLTIYQTGTQLASGTCTTPGTAGVNLSIGRDVLSGFGGPDQFNGDIAEVILYNAVLSTTNRQTVENYLINKYALLQPCAAPTFNPVAGTYASAQTVTISTSTGGASIRYTTDGSTPSATAGTVYSSAVTIGVNTTLNAVAYKSGMAVSPVSTGYYISSAPRRPSIRRRAAIPAPR